MPHAAPLESNVPRRIVVAGTDTGVGKTWVAGALARALSQGGHPVVAIKPIESGCAIEASEEEDGVQLARATGQPAPRTALHRFREPIAPGSAADLAGIRLPLADVAAAIVNYDRCAGIMLIEGAGGVLSPLGWDWNVLDLARMLHAGVLLVAENKLGCINHTLLTLQAVRAYGLPVYGVVLNSPRATVDASSDGNAAAIRRLTGSERVERWGQGAGREVAPDQLATVVSWIEGDVGA